MADPTPDQITFLITWEAGATSIGEASQAVDTALSGGGSILHISPTETGLGVLVRAPAEAFPFPVDLTSPLIPVMPGSEDGDASAPEGGAE